MKTDKNESFLLYGVVIFIIFVFYILDNMSSVSFNEEESYNKFKYDSIMKAWESESELEESKKEEERILRAYNRMDCKIDIECWDRLLDSFFNTMLRDFEDGVLDGNYMYGDNYGNKGWFVFSQKINPYLFRTNLMIRRT